MSHQRVTTELSVAGWLAEPESRRPLSRSASARPIDSRWSRREGRQSNPRPPGVLVALQVVLLHGDSVRRRVAILLPVGVLLVIYAYVRAVALTYARGGIRWRGTFYSLKELRDGTLGG